MVVYIYLELFLFLRFFPFLEALPVNKSELIEKLAERSGMNVMQAEEIVNLIYNKMRDTLVNGGRIEIRGFGSFVVKEYEAYQGRNPKTGEKISVPPKKLPFFKVGKELKERIDKFDGSTENRPANQAS